MGRRRRKLIKKKVVKPPPKIFMCPKCNVEAVTVNRIEDEEYVEVRCTNCGVNAKVRWYPAYSFVDAYAEFYDIVTGAKKPIEVAVEQSQEPYRENIETAIEDNVTLEEASDKTEDLGEDY